MSEYRPPDLVAGYVARRLLSSDSTTIPGLRAPTPTETAELGALAHVFAGVRVTPAQAQRAAARASARRTGVAAHAGALRQHCVGLGGIVSLIRGIGWARRADGKDADERALARAAVAPVRALADALFAGTGTTTESPADSDSSAKDPPFTPFGREDALALAAARWFKHEFFRWVDPIKCAQCGSATQSAAAGTPTEEERAGGAGRVEVHRCTVCGADRRFPRYNRVRALIASREGRCGKSAIS
jgi:hypothetical protein